MFADEDCKVSFEDILMFTSGVCNVPALGMQCFVDFQHTRGLGKEKSKYPLANTCTLRLTLPTVHLSYMSFESAMAFAVKNGQEGFAFA